MTLEQLPGPANEQFDNLSSFLSGYADLTSPEKELWFKYYLGEELTPEEEEIFKIFEEKDPFSANLFKQSVMLSLCEDGTLHPKHRKEFEELLAKDSKLKARLKDVMDIRNLLKSVAEGDLGRMENSTQAKAILDSAIESCQGRSQINKLADFLASPALLQKDVGAGRERIDNLVDEDNARVDSELFKKTLLENGYEKRTVDGVLYYIKLEGAIPIHTFQSEHSGVNPYSSMDSVDSLLTQVRRKDPKIKKVILAAYRVDGDRLVLINAADAYELERKVR